MTKKLGIFDVNVLVSGEAKAKAPTPSKRRTIKASLGTVVMQMRAAKLAERTVGDYETYVKSFVDATGHTYLDEIDVASIYVWLASMEVSNNTLLIRLKCFKAFLGKCFNNGWIKERFWHPVNVKVDKQIKRGTTDEQIAQVLSVIDMSTFVGLRDAVAVVMLYRTGLRVGSLVSVLESDIDSTANTITLQGAQLKNRKPLILPLPPELVDMVEVLIEQNDIIRGHYGMSNNYLFINKDGTQISPTSRHNTIQRRIRGYSQKYDIPDINPHALRRGFAKALLNKGADIVLISKALGHSDLSVTTQYLYFESREIVDSLRGYL
ncbi:tyrosine-type recombinase/integrase [Listeria booriae]|uniref:Site-specific integrase n=1 Tax=Listeria booriae TaxID=1552123 RepID=A0A7X0TL14_9LIST|nr:tyrosine-type recombinase/integrase [Listeria booriae]MBC1331028.1 site-specific integrase [Listeria booriae]MBC2386338.1 site-specific integrase [Listeria booriae]